MQPPVDSFEQCEEFYKQGLVHTVSVQRMVLVLYERLLLLVKQARASEDQKQLRKQLAQAQQVLTHMLRLFLDNSSLGGLYQSHDRIGQQLTEAFRQRRFQPEALDEPIRRLENYQALWNQQMQIRPRFPDEAAARLNIRRVSQSAES